MRNGFSLVELSIVLVILGLLVGGVLTGQNLIRAAELRSVTVEFSGYQSAVQQFRDKYFALPGDMKNTTASCPGTAGTGTQTCDGDGDGKIETGSAGQSNQYNESFTFWQHLANAGLIEGLYTGIAGSANGWHSTVGDNIPSSKLGNSGWTVDNLSNYSGSSNWFSFDYQNYYAFGASSANSWAGGAILRPAEVWNIDKKVVDGLPGTGRLLAYRWDSCTNAATNGSSTISDRTGASYLLTETAFNVG